jgi:archaellum component FlaC
MTIDERVEALVMTAELHQKELETIGERLDTIGSYIQADAENIRALARIAEIHERRLETLEGGQP